MLSLHDVSAWIEVDGKELEQYGVDEDAERSRVTCWIASQVGKNFSVVFKDNATHRDHSLASLLDLDGSPINGKVLRQSPNIVAGRTAVQNDHTLSATSSRPFIFSQLELTDEDEYLNQISTHLGEICIRIYRVQPLETILSLPDSAAPGHGKVHERSKKAVTHCVSYGPVKMATQYSCRVKYLDGKIPFATFIFKYRDAGLLQASGAIPKQPVTKKRTATCDRVPDLTAKPELLGEEIEILDGATQKRMTGRSSKRLKTNSKSETQPRKRMKREKTFVPGEVIDLT